MSQTRCESTRTRNYSLVFRFEFDSERVTLSIPLCMNDGYLQKTYLCFHQFQCLIHSWVFPKSEARDVHRACKDGVCFCNHFLDLFPVELDQKYCLPLLVFSFMEYSCLSDDALWMSMNEIRTEHSLILLLTCSLSSICWPLLLSSAWLSSAWLSSNCFLFCN